MKFAHIGDCHLGGWRQPKLKLLNFQSFQVAVDICIKERVDFILIAGDLFDSAYPSIDILKEAFSEFRKLKEANIPVFLIAGSHDYSVSGKTFLDVLDKAGFCKNVENFEERDGKIILQPVIFKNTAIYGYPGKKSGLEVDEVERIKLQDAPGLFKILMLHTTIRDAVRNTQIKAVDERNLPKVDYLALSHLHIKYNRENRVYSGPLFPNSIPELEELQGGSFCIFDSGRLRRIDIKIKEIITKNLEIKNALTATEEILSELKRENVSDKIVIVKLYGILEIGKTSDLDFNRIESYLSKNGAFVFLKSTTKLHMAESEIKVESIESSDLEGHAIEIFEKSNPSRFNSLIFPLIRTLQAERLDDEKNNIFDERVISETRKAIGL